jgi:hypothetical protein
VHDEFAGDVTNGLVLTGQVASGIHDLISVAEFVPQMAEQAAGILRRLTASLALVEIGRERESGPDSEPDVTVASPSAHPRWLAGTPETTFALGEGPAP